MPLIRHNDKIVFFAHIPKTGGTSVEDAVRDAGATVALHVGSRFQGFMKVTFQHLHAEIYTATIPPEFYDYGFATVRHPITRLVSEYFYRKRRGLANIPFDEWVNAILDGYEKNPYILDNHVRPQVEFITDGIDVFRIEDGLDEPLLLVAGVLGLTLTETNPHSNKRKKKKTVTWTALTRDRVRAFYAQDFARFGYDPEEEFDVVEVVAMDVLSLIWRKRPVV